MGTTFFCQIFEILANFHVLQKSSIFVKFYQNRRTDIKICGEPCHVHDTPQTRITIYHTGFLFVLQCRASIDAHRRVREMINNHKNSSPTKRLS